MGASIINYVLIGGEGGIRTPEPLSRLLAFEASSFNHLDTSPFEYLTGGGGEGGIRTLEGGINPLNGLANRPLKPGLGTSP